MIPIIVTAAGRSGTTLLMGILAQTPQVCVAEIVPYELRLIAYFATAYRTLTAPADKALSMHPDRLERDNYSVGFNPFNDQIYHSVFREPERAAEFFGTYIPRSISQAFREIITEYYTRLSADQGQASPFFFAEKNNNLARDPRDFARLAFPQVKEIVVYRDPRDLFCSHKSYFRSDSKRALMDVTSACHGVIAILEEAGSDLLALSYENLLRRPVETLRGLSEFLGFSVLPLNAAAQKAVFQQHGTSTSPLASIGRWKKDMTEEEQAAGKAAWNEFLTRFDYIH